MKKFILSVLFILTMFIAGYAESATTSDGAITLDYYEDTQSGIENRWILDMTINDFDGPGGVEEMGFELIFWNTFIDFGNQYNSNTDYYIFASYSTVPGPGHPAIMFPAIVTDGGQLYTPVGTNYVFYAMPDGMYFQPNIEYEPIIGDFYIRANGEDLLFTGPIGFSAVPEPMSMVLFVFGAFLLKFITKRK